MLVFDHQAPNLQSIFGESVICYQDLWKIDGVIERKIEKDSSKSFFDALSHFSNSLAIRQKQSRGKNFERGHKEMIEGLTRCIQKIFDTSNEIDQKRNEKVYICWIQSFSIFI